MSAIRDHLDFLYGPPVADQVEPRLRALMAGCGLAPTGPVQDGAPRSLPLSQRDVVLITYGDQVREVGKTPLASLHELLSRRVGDVIGTVHLLPFYPHSSDDGFSVIDYRAVDPHLGTWDEITRLGSRFRLMFDAVVNHISRHSDWFHAFVRDEAPYNGYFHTVDPGTDLSRVVRPRTLPLLTPVETARGTEHVWTTFSEDQVDLNFANPQVLLEIVDLLLFYVGRGASLIRLDAIAFLWKEIGTDCLHRPQTHHIIQLLRAVLDRVAPHVVLITETNVPHAENIGYFGDGSNEAQMVYNFTLPPLVLHAFATGEATELQDWAAGLTTPSRGTTFFNFMASHDGIGVRPVEGILTPAQIQAMARRAEFHGGRVSYRTLADGSQSPYELNITYYDALNDPNSGEPQELQVDRFLCSQAILLSLAGVPGIYVHSLFGSRNWQEGVVETGRNRTINRQKFVRQDLERELDDVTGVRHRVFQGYRALLQARRGHPAFHPLGGQEILRDNPAIFAVLRSGSPGVGPVLCLHNVTPGVQRFTVEAREGRDLLGGRQEQGSGGRLSIGVPPYGVRWLELSPA